MSFAPGDAWNLPSEGTGVKVCRLVSPAEWTGALEPVLFLLGAPVCAPDVARVHSKSVRTTTTTTPTTTTPGKPEPESQKPRPEDMRAGKPEPYALGKDFDDWDFTFNGYAGTLDPGHPVLLPTTVMATPHTNSSLQHCLYFLTMLTRRGARKVVRKAGNNGFEANRQLCLMYGACDQEGSTGLFVQIMTYKCGSKIEDVEDRLNEFLELVRRYDEANGTDPVPDQVKKACIISNTLEPLMTHLQLNVAKLGNFNALRMATEDYVRSRRSFKTTSAGNTHDEDSMEVDAISRQGKGKGKSDKDKKGGKKGKESHPGRGYEETRVEHSRFEGECRNCGKYGHKAADCWYKQPPKPQGKGKGPWKSKSKVTEISESDSSKQVEEIWTPNTFPMDVRSWSCAVLRIQSWLPWWLSTRWLSESRLLKTFS